MSEPGADAALTEQVRARYAAAAQRAAGSTACCDTTCCSDTDDVITRNLYSTDETEALPTEATLASLGCGNPTALIDLHAGETVLDLGSGGGIDVLLSARRVGPEGLAIGLDMTDEMLALALANRARAGQRNAIFLRGRIEEIPLPAGSVDVVISNCVINLAADKRRVLGEAWRVLKPGGRFAVADVVAEEPVPTALRQDVAAWTGCLAGALEIPEYATLLTEVGFAEVAVEVTRRYTVPVGDGAAHADGVRMASAFVRAVKPITDAAGPRRKALPMVAAVADACCGKPECACNQ